MVVSEGNILNLGAEWKEFTFNVSVEYVVLYEIIWLSFTKRQEMSRFSRAGVPNHIAEI